MKIGFDLRSLSSGTISGVENYSVNVLQNLLEQDKQNEYRLFYNSLKQPNLPDFNYVNSKTLISRFPSKLLNSALKFNFKKIEDFTGSIDWFFMPNLNQFSVSPETKLALTVHDLSPVITPEFYDLKRRIWHKFLNYKKAFERADVIFAVSNHTKEDLKKIFNIADSKIVVAYPGVDPLQFNPNIPEAILRTTRTKYELPGEYILFLNTIEPRKNLPTLIKAFENINSSSTLVIAGRLGWKYGDVFKLINKSKKKYKIKYIGYVEEENKPALLKMAKALVYPSFYEGFGFQAVEAMAVGTPVLVSQVTSLPEVVGDSGLLVNPYDQNSITIALQEILEDNELRARLIEKGKNRAKIFTWKNTSEIILNHIK